MAGWSFPAATGTTWAGWSFPAATGTTWAAWATGATWAPAATGSVDLVDLVDLVVVLLSGFTEVDSVLQPTRAAAIATEIKAVLII